LRSSVTLWITTAGGRRRVWKTQEFLTFQMFQSRAVTMVECTFVEVVSGSPGMVHISRKLLRRGASGQPASLHTMVARGQLRRR
jgi:hypothetical protein